MVATTQSSIVISANQDKTDSPVTAQPDAGFWRASFNADRTTGIQKYQEPRSSWMAFAISKGTNDLINGVKRYIDTINGDHKEYQESNRGKALLKLDAKGALSKFDRLFDDFGSYVDTSAQLLSQNKNAAPYMGSLAKAVESAGLARLSKVKSKALELESALKEVGLRREDLTPEGIAANKEKLTGPALQKIKLIAKEFDTSRSETAKAMKSVVGVIQDTIAEVSRLEGAMSPGVQSWMNSKLEGASKKYSNVVAHHLTNPQAKENELVKAKNEFIESYKTAIRAAEELNKSSKGGLEAENKLKSLLDNLKGENHNSQEHQMHVDADSTSKVYVKISGRLGGAIASWVEGFTETEKKLNDAALKEGTLEDQAKHGAALAAKMKEVENVLQKIGAVLAKSHNRYDEDLKKNISALDRVLQLDPKENPEVAINACGHILQTMESETDNYIINRINHYKGQEKGMTSAHFEQIAKDLAFTSKAIKLLETHVSREGKVCNWGWEHLAKEAKIRIDQGFASLKKKEDEVVVPAELKKMADEVFAPEKVESTFFLAKQFRGVLNYFKILRGID
jgi:hypothetical protein